MAGVDLSLPYLHGGYQRRVCHRSACPWWPVVCRAGSRCVSTAEPVGGPSVAATDGSGELASRGSVQDNPSKPPFRRSILGDERPMKSPSPVRRSSHVSPPPLLPATPPWERRDWLAAGARVCGPACPSTTIVAIPHGLWHASSAPGTPRVAIRGTLHGLSYIDVGGRPSSDASPSLGNRRGGWMSDIMSQTVAM